MKFLRAFLPALSAVLLLTACNDKSETQNEAVYLGKGEEWLATYSLFKVNHSWFDSLYIQNIGEDRGSKIGPIEYRLIGGEGFEMASQYPLELQGVRSLHVSSEMNADFFTIHPNDEGVFELSITKTDGQTETLALSAITP
ncbi:hypothetical protein [Cohnella thailandensis]|uniref:Uncharacterized protein n=1 Tax=Cohnella thailandensis TaxID=557557 RepID=A0A841T3K5_9BACL|nr:hypothetical protein [Cohnella thailandensis]MBB6638202.1 hypothetical protein [Cohnella thailandensis]MBP1977760.1 hypothetical protein [Cohnella thailandensis]